MKNMKVDNIKSLIELLTNESVVVKFSIGSDLLLLLAKMLRKCKECLLICFCFKQ